MPRLSPSVIPLIAVSLVSSALAQAPVAEVSPLIPDPYIDPLVITDDGNGNIVERFHQCEVRHVGNGVYRVAATVRFVDPNNAPSPLAYSNLISGQLDLSVSPPVWTPLQDIALIDSPGPAVNQFQVSISHDGLCCAWDHYGGTTYSTPSGAQTGITFVCRRASTAVQFAVADVRAVQNVANHWVDPHLGHPQPNGNYAFYFVDFTGTPVLGSIMKGEIDPATGVVTGAAVAITYNQPPFNVFSGFLHSHYMLFDSQGEARAMYFSEYGGSGHSNAWFTEAIDDSGTPEQLIAGTGPNSPTQGNLWLNNPGHLGGTMHQCSDGAGQWFREVLLLANAVTDGNGDFRIPAWSPVQPQQTSSDYISVLGLGLLLPLPIPIQGVNGQLFVTSDILLPIAVHDPYEGLAEWVGNIPPGVTPFMLDTQLATLNTATSQIYLSNTAQFRH